MKQTLKQNLGRHKLVVFFSFLFSFIFTYTVTFWLLLADNDVQEQFFKFAFPATFILGLFVSYASYFVYLYVVKKLLKDRRALKLLYGPIISSIFGVVSTFILFIRSKTYMNLALIDSVRGFTYYHNLAWNLNKTYLPKIFLIMFILIILIDLLFVFLKFKQAKLRSIVAILAGGIVISLLTLVIGIAIFILEILLGIFYGGFNPA